MALGKKIIVWDGSEIVKGASTSEDISDGGFSPNTDAVNLINSPGVIHLPNFPTDASTNLVDTIVASCSNGTSNVSTGTANRFFLAVDLSSTNATYYYWDGSTLTLKRTDNTNAYALAKANIETFGGEVYATSNTKIIRWIPDSTFDVAFFDLTGPYAAAANVPHPILVFENNIFYGDGTQLLRQTGAGTTPAVILSLDVGQIIVALGIDPGSGKMLISTTNEFAISNQFASVNKVLYYDGFSNKVLKSVIVDDMITAFPFTEGQLYVAYGQNLGLWNGAGITFLRKFPLTYSSTSLFYKNHFTSAGSTLYFIVESQIYAHGPLIQGGPKVFYPAMKNYPSGTPIQINHIANIGQGVLGISYVANGPTDKFATFNTTSISSNNPQDIFSNTYNLQTFQDGAWVRRARLFFQTPVAIGNIGNLFLYNENGFINPGGVFPITNTTGGTTAMIEIPLGGGTTNRVYQFQFRLIMNGGTSYGIRRVEIFADPANQ